MADLKLDLHPIYNDRKKINQALREVIAEAREKNLKKIEIVTGKGSGQLKKHVLKFLQQKHIKEKYHRIDKDSQNYGRLFIWFKTS